MIVELLIFITCLITLLILFHQKPKDLPPGEWGLPVLGYVPFTKWKLADTLHLLEKKHGKIFSLKLGVRTFIVIGDYSLIKEAFNKTEITGRTSVFGYDLLVKNGDLGLVTNSGQIWKTNRRFALKTLKEFGMGKSKLEEFVHTEAEYLVKELKEHVNKPFRIDWNMNVAVLNVIWRLVANRRYNINDKEIKEFSQYANECFVDVEGPMSLFAIFPWLLPLIPNFLKNSWMRVETVRNKRDILFDYILNVINEHKKNLDPNDPKDYIDKYLIEREQQKNEAEYQHWGDDDLTTTVFELFLGGSDTTSSTLRWFFIYMAKYPNIQKRVQEEIDIVLPRDKLPSMQDKERLPCLQALSYELGRVISLLPTAIPHEVTQEVTLAGYQIPKGCLIVPNIESIHTNPALWKNPNEFSIDNFLDEEGKFVLKEGFMLFSIGRRQCLGENLAKMELFLFMGAILQNFDILEPDGQKVSLIPDQSSCETGSYFLSCIILTKPHI